MLDDGAGVSYGINQFTHRSGALAAVVETYLENGGQLAKEILQAALPTLKRKSAASINKLSLDARFKRALRVAAVTREMKAAQQQIAFEKYLRPALEICEARQFVLPLSLAVVYDSINHGSWERVSRKVSRLSLTQAGKLRSDEKEWITEYVRKRHLWLSSVKRLKATCYRTQFFLDQIAVGNWDLRLPMTVHGFRLTEEHFPLIKTEPEATDASVDGASRKSILTKAGEVVSSAAEKFDRVDNVVTTVTRRRDAAKSLWTTIIGTISQAVWAVFGVVAGLPREVWIMVAVIAGALMLLFLYRQIALGRIREQNAVGSFQ